MIRGHGFIPCPFQFVFVGFWKAFLFVEWPLVSWKSVVVVVAVGACQREQILPWWHSFRGLVFCGWIVLFCEHGFAEAGMLPDVLYSRVLTTQEH